MEENTVQEGALGENTSSGAFPISEPTLKALECLSELLPYLDENLGLITAYRELGGITQDEYQYVLMRHRDANLIISVIDFENKCLGDDKFGRLPNYEDRMTMIASWCIVDARAHATEDLKGEEQAKLLDLIDKLQEALKGCGYNKILPTYQIPIK